MKRNTSIRDALGFDDVVIVPAETQVRPDQVSTRTRLTKTIELSVPLVSAARDNVTESAMAIAIARAGGIGVIHDNMPPGKQVEEVRRVKRAESRVIATPITTSPEASAAEAADLMLTYKISGLPVVDHESKKVAGIITARDLRFFDDYSKTVGEMMSKNLVSAKPGTPDEEIKKLMQQRRVEKVVLVDEQGRCAGLVTARDFDRQAQSPQATRDASGALRVAAAVGVGKDAFDRAGAMADVGLDVLFVEAAHAHTRDVVGTVSRIRQQRSSSVQIVAGNVVTLDAARSLIDAGADAIKVGIGSAAGSAIRRLGVGMPQLSAVLDVVEQCEMQGIPVIVDGGINCAANLAKALAAGAESAVVGSLFSGAREAPGSIVYVDGMPYKIVSLDARPQHRPPAVSAASQDPLRLDEEKPDTSRPCTGDLADIVSHLMSGLRVAMAYAGAKDIAALRETAELVRAR